MLQYLLKIDREICHQKIGKSIRDFVQHTNPFSGCTMTNNYEMFEYSIDLFINMKKRRYCGIY